MQIVETTRLVIRHFSLADAPFIMELVNQPSFIENIGDREVHNLADAEGYLTKGPLASYKLHGHGLSAVLRKSDKALVGMCGLLKRDYLDAPDIGYAYMPAFWGQGYAQEAAKAILMHGKMAFGYKRVFAIINPSNARSIHVVSKLGFQFTGLVTPPNEERQILCYTKNF